MIATVILVALFGIPFAIGAAWLGGKAIDGSHYIGQWWRARKRNRIRREAKADLRRVLGTNRTVRRVT